MDLKIKPAVEAIIRAIRNPAVLLVDIDSRADIPVDDRGRGALHVRFFVEVAPSAPFALARGGTILRRGFVQVDVYSPESADRSAAAEAGQHIVDAFPRLTQLGLARVERPAYASRPMQETPYFRVPVTIPWNARVPEGGQ